MAPSAPWITAAVTLTIVALGVVANYAIMTHRVADLRESNKAILAKLEPFAALAYEIAALKTAKDTHDAEIRRARVKIHDLDNALGKALMVLHLIRRGVPVPAEAVAEITAHMKKPEPDENGGK